MAQTKGTSNVPSGLVSCDWGSFSVTFHRDTSFPAVGARSGQRCFKRTAADLFATFPFFILLRGRLSFHGVIDLHNICRYSIRAVRMICNHLICVRITVSAEMPMSSQQAAQCPFAKR